VSAPNIPSILGFAGLSMIMLTGAAPVTDSPIAHLWRGEFEQAQVKASQDDREKAGAQAYAQMVDAGVKLAKQDYASARAVFSKVAKSNGFIQVAGWWACETHRLAGEPVKATACFKAAGIAPTAAMQKLSKLGRKAYASARTGEVKMCRCQAYCSMLPIGPQVCQTMTWNAHAPQDCLSTRPLACER